MSAQARKVAIAANSPWNLLIFRRGLMLALHDAGFEPYLIVPGDPKADRLFDELGFERVFIAISRSGLNPIADARLLLSYRRLLRRTSPCAFLGFTIKPNIYGCLAARLPGIPANAHVRGLRTA